MDYLLFIIEVQHVYRWHLRGGAAWPCWSSRIGMLNQMSMWVLLHEHVLTLAWTVVCLVTFGCNDPVPAKSFKVHCERVATTAGFCGVFITVKSQISPWALGCFKNLDFQEWLLEITGGRRHTEMGQAPSIKSSIKCISSDIKLKKFNLWFSTMIIVSTIAVFWSNRSKGPYQSFLSRLQRRHSQVIAILIIGIYINAPVCVWLLEPVLQHMFEINALPMTCLRTELYFEWPDTDVSASLLSDRFKAKDLQVNSGSLL